MAGFTVFLDSPSSPAAAAPARGTTPLSPSRATSFVLSLASALGAAAENKENLHPVTGAPASAPGAAGTKKRKTSVLETKLLAPAAPAAKKHKDASGASSSSTGGADGTGMADKPKRRPLAASGSSVSAPASPTKAPKPRKARTTAGAAKRTAQRRVRALPKVDEEVELPAPAPAPAREQTDVERHAAVVGVYEDVPMHGVAGGSAAPAATMRQVAIDARCYELTVAPLADVSEAYDAPGAMLPAPGPKRAKHADAALRDYFGDAPLPSTRPRALKRAVSAPVTLGSFGCAPAASSPPARPPPSCAPDAAADAAPVFTTPERAHIYAAFTFASPSPTSARLRRARSTSVDRFGDIPFCPVEEAV